MKKLLFFLMVLGLGAVANNANAASYKLDNAKVDNMFNAAEETGVMTIAEIMKSEAAVPCSVAAVGEKDALVAILLDFFVGGLGIHRFYLGTKPLTGIGYFLTCGGVFGIVPLVDLVVLAINMDDISDYIDNPKFFMW